MKYEHFEISRKENRRKIPGKGEESERWVTGKESDGVSGAVVAGRAAVESSELSLPLSLDGAEIILGF